MIGFLLLFFLGLSFGSFFNVLILRYDPEGKFFDIKKLSGRSHCPKCMRTLGPGELIPVFSFIFLGGKCLHCRERISFFYPFTELLTGIVFAGIPYFLNGFYGISNAVFWIFALPTWYYTLVLFWLIAIVTLVLIALVDFKYYLIPDELEVILFLAGAAVSLLLFYCGSTLIEPFRDSFLKNYAIIFSPTQNVLISHAFGALIGGLFFLLLVVLSRGRGIGFGDVKLAFASGAVLGWPDIGLAVVLSFILGGIVGVILLALRSRGMKDKVPYAPFFVIGVLLTVVLGHAIIFNYFRLFGM